VVRATNRMISRACGPPSLAHSAGCSRTNSDRLHDGFHPTFYDRTVTTGTNCVPGHVVGEVWKPRALCSGLTLLSHDPHPGAWRR
jgi:hypothetical protein